MRALTPPEVGESGFTVSQASKTKFLEAGPFHQALKSRVENYFQESGRTKRDQPAMYLKTGVLLSWFVASYVFLLLGANHVLEVVLGCLSLGFGDGGNRLQRPA